MCPPIQCCEKAAIAAAGVFCLGVTLQAQSACSLTRDRPFVSIAFVQYWRELGKIEQKAALEKAEDFFSQFATPAELKKKLSPKEFAKLHRLAEQQITAFDLPQSFTERARQGLFASLMACAADEEDSGQPYSGQQVAAFHALLLKEG